MTTLPPPPSGVPDPQGPQSPFQFSGQGGSPAPASGQAPPMQQPWWVQPQPKRKSWGRRILVSLGVLIFIGSILMNFALLVVVGLGLGESGGLQTTTVSEGSSSQVVAVYTIQGTIGDDTVAEFRKFYRQVKKDSDIKAIVLRVDSPGGTVSASDQIYSMVLDIRDSAKKPVVVSMGGVAASGGYYISAPANWIVAENTTITGSIGVISVWPVIKDFLNTHGVEIVTIRSRQSQGNKAAENFWENPSDRARKDVEDMLTKMHERFAQVVTKGRTKLVTKNVNVTVSDGKNTVQVPEIEPLNGKVYMAQEAKDDWHLVDQIGYLSDAVAKAARLAGLNNPKEVHYVKTSSFRELIGASQSAPLVDPKTLDKLMSPQVMYLWKVD